ncbi:MAG: bifunctional 5,10-methylenetetrahydrofolate dehydrogenase/5,10-methenyltetrahydrofolate cyclohydrolase [Deltaproteobacteria bacterium]|nr:bifunctional 5,10-methylenetetrahydrofolate dehydrogenase/5,10-methenyltetrahydrofolate cyclohydrolase [Deltaproteobacteria bacterium]
MAEILKGKPVADAMKEELTKKVEALKAKNISPKLGIIRVGERPDDLFYEGGAKKTCAAIGMDCEVFEFPVDIAQDKIEKAVTDIGAKKDVHGILMFFPLPDNLDGKKIRELIPVEKDVDCLTTAGAAKIFTDDPTGFPPCTPTACMDMLHFYNIPLKGKKCTVVGRSLVVGKPLAMLLLREHATVTICHSRTENLPAVCQDSDILIAAVGRAKMIKSNYVKPGQIVIDVGINADPDNPGKYCGDVDFQEAEPVVARISPVPAGVGSVTTSVLCKQAIKACEQQYGI